MWPADHRRVRKSENNYNAMKPENECIWVLFLKELSMQANNAHKGKELNENLN